jgi:DNA uptake protein ComE-like DNA-binding protein
MFSKKQRSGVFLLILITLSIQCFYFFYDFDVVYDNSNDDQIALFQREVDSLVKSRQSSLDSVYFYNPNFISDYKGYLLGMSLEEIDRLHSFRKTGQFVNSVNSFQKITLISDSLLQVMSPSFKFPDWKVFNGAKKSYEKDLNSANVKDIKKAVRISYKLAHRIINFREKLNGFLSIDQLNDVYGITNDVIEKMKRKFVLESFPTIKKININLATAKELSQLVYISDYLAVNIVDERLLREGFSDLNELRFVQGFPLEKLERIKLYLTIN